MLWIWRSDSRTSNDTVHYPIVAVMGREVFLFCRRMDRLRQLEQLLRRLWTILLQKMLGELASRAPFLAKRSRDEHSGDAMFV